VLPVGGIKEKVLAARRVGIREVVIPRQNEKNVKEDFSDDLRREIRIHLVSTVDEVLALVLAPAAAPVEHAATPQAAPQPA
jgi:ATP-dependent Lon protease